METKMETMGENTPSITNLIASLEQSIQLAKQLPITSNPSHLLQIYSSLHSTNTHLSSFLDSHPIPPSPPPPPAAAGDNSQSDEPMEVGDNEEIEEAEQNTVIEKVEERFRDCFIQNKRPKRRRSPATEQRVYEYSGVLEFDPFETKMRALDLVYQFHA